MCIISNYCVLGTSTAAICLSNEYSLHAPIYLGWMSCLISFVLYQWSCRVRVESKKNAERKILTLSGTRNPQPWDLKYDVYNRYKLEIDEVDRMKRKRRRSDSVLWQNPLYQQKIRKPKDNTKTPPKLRLHNDCGPTKYVLFCVTYWNIAMLFK